MDDRPMNDVHMPEPMRTIVVLEYAAGLPGASRTLELELPEMQRTIDLLESLGFIEVRLGNADDGEDPDLEYVVAITSLGEARLRELRKLDMENGAKQ